MTSNSKYSNEVNNLQEWIMTADYDPRELRIALDNVMVNCFNDGINAAIEARPEKWLTDPKYQAVDWLSKDPNPSSSYFKALGHDNAIDHWKSNLKALIGGDDV